MKLSKILKSPTFRIAGIFAGGNFLVAVLGGIGGLIQARWIGPDILGEFAKFGILTTYLSIGAIFVNEGLSRQFPFLLGKGEKDSAVKVAATAKWWYLFICLLFSVVFATLSIWSLIHGNYRAAVGWGVQILSVLAVNYGLFLSTMYRTSFDFKRLSYNSVIAKISDSFALVFVYFWEYWGIAIRFVIGSAASLYMNRRYVPVKVKAVFNSKELLSLVKISLPLALPGYIGSSFLTACISFIILKYCGEHGLGIYGMSVSLQAMALIPNQAIHQMFMTKLTYKYGETENVRACLKYIKLPTFLSVFVAIVLALILYFAISPFIHLLLPKYIDAIPVIRILALQLPIFAAGIPLHMFSAALWYKNLQIMTLVRFLAPLAAIAIMPKTLNMIVSCIIFGTACNLFAGYLILGWKVRQIHVPQVANV